MMPGNDRPEASISPLLPCTRISTKSKFFISVKVFGPSSLKRSDNIWMIRGLYDLTMVCAHSFDIGRRWLSNFTFVSCAFRSCPWMYNVIHRHSSLNWSGTWTPTRLFAVFSTNPTLDVSGPSLPKKSMATQVEVVVPPHFESPLVVTSKFQAVEPPFGPVNWEDIDPNRVWVWLGTIFPSFPPRSSWAAGFRCQHAQTHSSPRICKFCHGQSSHNVWLEKQQGGMISLSRWGLCHLASMPRHKGYASGRDPCHGRTCTGHGVSPLCIFAFSTWWGTFPHPDLRHKHSRLQQSK